MGVVLLRHIEGRQLLPGLPPARSGDLCWEQQFTGGACQVHSDCDVDPVHSEEDHLLDQHPWAPKSRREGLECGAADS